MIMLITSIILILLLLAMDKYISEYGIKVFMFIFGSIAFLLYLFLGME